MATIAPSTVTAWLRATLRRMCPPITRPAARPWRDPPPHQPIAQQRRHPGGQLPSRAGQRDDRPLRHQPCRWSAAGAGAGEGAGGAVRADVRVPGGPRPQCRAGESAAVKDFFGLAQLMLRDALPGRSRAGPIRRTPVTRAKPDGMT